MDFYLSIFIENGNIHYHRYFLSQFTSLSCSMKYSETFLFQSAHLILLYIYMQFLKELFWEMTEMVLIYKYSARTHIVQGWVIFLSSCDILQNPKAQWVLAIPNNLPLPKYLFKMKTLLLNTQSSLCSPRQRKLILQIPNY